MLDSYRRSWRSLLSEPEGEIPPPARVESLIAALSLSLVLGVFWLLMLVLTAPGYLGLGQFRGEVIAPLGILIVGILLGALLPLSWLRASGLAYPLVHARREGGLSTWDKALLLAGAVALLLYLVPSISTPHFVPALLLTINSICVLLALRLAPEDPLQSKTWQFRLPDWLNIRQDSVSQEREFDGQDEMHGRPRLFPPDDNALPIYGFRNELGDTHSIGLRIPQELLSALRSLNSENDGRLYDSLPQSVVNCLDPPVDGLGTEELSRLASQIGSIGDVYGWTKAQMANRVLEFVQEAIEYQFDEDSTDQFPGGPYSEYGRFAIETIADGVGDCECTAILCASLLSYLGYPTALLHVTIEDLGGHVAVGVLASHILGEDEIASAGMQVYEAEDGRKYLYGETAWDGATFPFGIVPESWKGRLSIRKVEQIAPVVLG